MSRTKKAKDHPSGSDLAAFIDQTLLKAGATEADIIRLCKSAITHGFHAVCIPPYYVPLCKAILDGHGPKVATVIGFPLGATLKEVKVKEALRAVVYGAQELDIVMNISAAKSGNWDYVEEELAAIVSATRQVLHKVIIETCLLTNSEKVMAAQIAVACGAGFVKTSTGFTDKGATVRDIKLLRESIGDRAGLKASGGIKTFAQALKLIKAGATRIGTSSGVEILAEAMKGRFR